MTTTTSSEDCFCEKYDNAEAEIDAKDEGSTCPKCAMVFEDFMKTLKESSDPQQ
jgi:hypothetical protein